MTTRYEVLMNALSSVAWADGVLRPDEAQFFVEVVSQLGLPPEEAALVLQSVLAPRGVDDLDTAVLDEDDRRWALGFGYLMALSDGSVADTELNVLRTLAKCLEVAWTEAEELFAEVRAAHAQAQEGGQA